jgi:hypothetical protein
MKVGDKILILRGIHQNETGTIRGFLELSGNLMVEIDGWPGHYSVRRDDCTKI